MNVGIEVLLPKRVGLEDVAVEIDHRIAVECHVLHLRRAGSLADLSCPGMKLGVLPRFHESVITDARMGASSSARSARRSASNRCGRVEHLLVAADYEPRYSVLGRRAHAGQRRDGDARPARVALVPRRLHEHGPARDERGGDPAAQPGSCSPSASATLDALCGGRVIFGVGHRVAGRGVRRAWVCRTRSEGPGPTSHRGPARALGDDPLSFTGPFVRCRPGVVAAEAGAGAAVAGRRSAGQQRGRGPPGAGRLGDGFFPYVISPDDFAARIERDPADGRRHRRDPDADRAHRLAGQLAARRRARPRPRPAVRRPRRDRLVVSAQEARRPRRSTTSAASSATTASRSSTASDPAFLAR